MDRTELKRAEMGDQSVLGSAKGDEKIVLDWNGVKERREKRFRSEWSKKVGIQ